MSETPRYTIRLPLYLKKSITEKVGKGKIAVFIIQAIIEKLRKS